MNSELISNIINVLLVLYIVCSFFSNTKYFAYKVLEKKERNEDDVNGTNKHYYFIVSNAKGFKKIEVSDVIFKLFKEGDTISAL